MKKVIKGAVCDTDTAEEIGEARCQGFIDCLYRTKSGKYFIHGVGDASRLCKRREGDEPHRRRQDDSSLRSVCT